MDGEILDVVTEWGTRSVADGLDGVYDLVDAEFSGAVTDGTAWAFFLNGRVVGVFDGDVDDFEDASLTAYTAPDISLPLLYAMQAGGGETRGQYYSNETPLSETDDTLSSGNFVGYVELSENVLSGDYYVVYYGGRSLPVAFVGNERRLLTGDEAFERADDEVGIYSVVDAAVNVVDLPDRPDPEPAGGGVAAGVGSTDVDEETTDSAAADADTAADASDTDDGTPTDEFGSGVVSADPTVEEETETESVDEPVATDAQTDEPVAMNADADAQTDDTPDLDASAGEPTDGASTVPDWSAAADDEASDPDVEVDERSASAATAVTDASESADPDDVERLRSELDAARAARDEAVAERDDYREEVERLRDRIEELEAQLHQRTDADDATTERTLAPDEALSGTNLFVRYEEKSEATVERAVAGQVSREELRTNLRLDYHTEFETAGLRVEGRPFDDFIRGTTEHRFVEWLLTELLYEIRQTDAREGVSKLYEAIERVDRIDLDGEVTVDADGETAVSFDVVCRDKMGDPLFVADFSDSRDPTRASSIEELLDRSTSVGESQTALAAAAFVTTSFFDADAMEAAVDATRGGLFSRSSRRSYVKLSRKRGFHLCLVEARDEDFFLTVPDL